jgi:hypothetical protein
MTRVAAQLLRGWDGTLMVGEPQPYGAYVWQLSGECIDKATGQKTLFEEKGSDAVM